jgi:hypothetical protein
MVPRVLVDRESASAIEARAQGGAFVRSRTSAVGLQCGFMRVGQRTIGDGEPVLVVAEIGNNHDGGINQAERLIEAAAEAGADAVKFQTHIAFAEMLPSTPTPPHFDEPRFTFTERMELSLDDHMRLKEFAEERDLIFFSSPFSMQAVDLLEDVGVELYKVASGEVTNPPLLARIVAIARRLTRSGGHGYADVHCMRTTGEGLRAATASAMSSSPDIPVESRTGLPVSAIRASSGGFVTSPEATL